MKKSEIVRKGLTLGAPFELTWSCYQNSEKACGRCESCELRLKGFREAGERDPIPYEDQGLKG
jgi:7-cyano-7-deazaguanine synthase